MKKVFRRTRLLIYPEFQLRLIAINVIIGLVIFGAAVIYLSSSFENLRQEALGAGIPLDGYYIQFLKRHSRLTYLTISSALVVSVVAGSLTTLWLSHKLVGPMIRLGNFMRQMGENPKDELIRPLQFRKNDCFREIPPLVNRAVRKLQKAHRAQDSEDSAPRKKAA